MAFLVIFLSIEENLEMTKIDFTKIKTGKRQY